MKDKIIFKTLMLKGDAGEPTDQQTQIAVDQYMQDHPEAAVDEIIINSAVSDWLDNHPEATTTVLDGSLTDVKFSDSLKLMTIKDYVTPEMFGAAGDGVTDDTDAIQNAIDSSFPVYMANDYLINESLIISSSKVIQCDGRITYTGSDSAIILSYSFCDISINELVTSKNGIEFKPTADSNFTACQENTIRCNRIICVGSNGIGLYINNNDSLSQFNKFIINRIQGGISSRGSNTGIKIIGKAQSNKYCNANLFDIHSICFCETAILTDTVQYSCISNYFKNINFEQNDVAIDMGNARFYMDACFDEPTSGSIKIKDGMLCTINCNGYLSETKLDFNAAIQYNSNIILRGDIISSYGVFITDNLFINKYGFFSKNAITPFASVSVLTNVIGDHIVKYIEVGDTIDLPQIRKGGVEGAPFSSYTFRYATISGNVGSITLSFSDNTTINVSLSKNSGVILITSNPQATGQWAYAL